jgi:hypothetical protein
MRHGKGADRPSALAMNPRNREASAARREQLLAAFLSLDENVQADLLEAVESLVLNAGISVSLERDRAREIIRQVYAVAGWEAS